MDPDADAGDSGQRGRHRAVCEAFHHAIMAWSAMDCHDPVMDPNGHGSKIGPFLTKSAKFGTKFSTWGSEPAWAAAIPAIPCGNVM